jgi:hypothetical protein
MREVAIVGAGMTPFAEHFSLGIKDLLPMAFAECAASVDKGLEVADIQRHGSASCRRRTAFLPGSSRTPAGCWTYQSPTWRTRARRGTTRCATR